MSRVTFTEVDALPDILDQVAFELILGQLPGAGASRHLSLKCTTVGLPGFSNEAYQVNLHGHQLNFRGRKIYPQTLPATFLEDSTFATQNALLRWHEQIVGSQSGNSQGYVRDYAVNAILVVYDTTGRAAARHSLERVFIQDVPDVNMSGESSAAVQVPVTFKYNRFLANTIIPL